MCCAFTQAVAGIPSMVGATVPITSTIRARETRVDGSLLIRP